MSPVRSSLLLPRAGLRSHPACRMIAPAFIIAFNRMVSLSASVPAATLNWTPARDLPEANGLKGMVAGVTGGRILLAGGSNFPVPKRAGGGKTYHCAGWMQPVSAGGRGPWTPLGDVLMHPLAEGASVTTPHGIVSLGGDGGSGMLADVFLLAWNERRGAPDRHALPALPLAVGGAAAAWHEGKVYVAGGDDGRGGTLLWAALDLVAAQRDPAAARWESLPAWPGPRRFGAALVPVAFPQGVRLVLAGGKIGTPGPAVQRDYLDDAYAFDPVARSWHSLPPMPRRALLAVAFSPAPGRLIIAGGSDGHDIERVAELGEGYRLPADAMVFDVATGQWSQAGEMPLGVAGASVVPLPGGGHLVAGGEYSPALRTPQVFVVEEAR